MLTAALLGGVVGAGLLYGLTVYGPAYGIGPQPGGDPTTASLDQRLAALAPRDSVQALDRRVAAAEAAAKAASDQAKTASDQAAEALRTAGAAPAPAAGSAPAAPVPAAAPASGDIQARFEAIDQRLAGLQNRTGDPELRQKLDALSQSVAGLQGRSDTSDLRSRLDGLDSGLKAVQADLGRRTAADEAADKALGGRLDALQQALDARGKAQEQRLADLAREVAGRAEAGTVQAGLRAVAADRIAAALAFGAPYADALAALKQLGPNDAAALAPLEPFAARGAPTAQALAQEFQGIGDRITAAVRAARQREVAERGSVTDRLASMASSIVAVRRTDAPAEPNAPASQGGDATEAAVAKVQAALDRGALPEAAAAFDAMPEAARKEAAAFGDTLKARVAAGEAARARLAAAFGALSGAAR